MDLKTKTRSRLQALLLAAALLLGLTSVLGGVLRSLGGLGSCGGWPLCGGNWIPTSGSLTLWMDYAHRLTSGLAVAAGLVSLGYLVHLRKKAGRLLAPVLLANLVLGAQTVLGAVLASGLNAGASTAVHFGFALIAQGLFLYPLVEISVPASSSTARRYSRRYLSWYALALGLVALVLTSGAAVTALQASSSCQGWPLCSGLSFSLSPLQWLVTGHRVLVLAAGISLTAVLGRAWRENRDQPAALTAAAAGLVLFISQGLMGSQTAVAGTAAYRSLHQAAGVGVWSALIVHGVLLVRNHSPQQPREQADRENRELRRMALDLLNLTKPIVVALLLVTTYAGMVIGGEAWPPLRLTFWVLLAGFLAAGGSGAVNQYIDRADDLRMQRTQTRPIPAGRLTPAEGLAFGTALVIASFYLMAAFVNMTAALLTLAGAVYYVLIYSIFLKKTTVHNIVIGGGAGAIPPLVGWAAATGGLNIPSLFLFAVVFMWTPPHFWALAIVRRKDYARADVPMLPVVEGVEKTRRQILVYTIELVVLTLLLPLFGLGGSIYFLLALGLGGWLLSAAWKVFKVEGNKVAWKMYRYSSMYLAFLFAALMVDALL